MIITGPEEQWINFTDPKLRNYCCIEYAMMGAYWLTTKGYKKAVVVTIGSIDTLPEQYQWAHSVCEVPKLGTYDFHHNIFFPDYYYHQGPVTDEQVKKSTRACAWTNKQRYTCINSYYKYQSKEVGIIQMSKYEHKQTKFLNGCNSKNNKFRT